MTAQTLIGGILYERVLENITYVGGHTAAENKLRLRQTCQSRFQLWPVDRRHIVEQGQWEFPAYDGADLADLLHAFQTIEARH